jgi:two-component system cell cycle sensor histidine kinase/response regulator CckA
MNRRPTVANQPARVLIVDDEPQNRQLLQVMLAPEGYLVVTAASGEEALAVVKQTPPDLVLLDIMMPGLDGYEVVAKIKADPTTRNIPVILVTALEDRSSRMRGLNAGAEDFLTKPVDRAELTARVRNLISLKAYGDYHDTYSRLLEAEIGSRTAELVDSERLYRSTFDNAPVGVAHVALDGRWSRVNQRLCDFLGYSREDLQSVNAREILETAELPGEAEALLCLAEGTLDRHVVDERRYRRQDGVSVWARVKTSVHRDFEGGAQHFIMVVEDITERRALEAQVRQASKMEAVGRLASGVAHDFNNLLSVVLSYSELLAEDLTEDDPMRADLEEIRGAGLRAVALTRQLLAFGRQQVMQPKIVDLREIVAAMERMLGRVIGEDVELTSTAALEVGKVRVDPGQVEQVIMNLAVNARDAMPQGGRLTISTDEVILDENFASEHIGWKPGRHVMLTVTDTGTGMDKATLGRIFEPFFTTKAVGKGTGLGLATVFGIVRQSGGSIRVDSEPGRGTVFTMYFPVADHDAVGRISAPPFEPQVLQGAETILLVEDEERVRTLACTILRKYGYNVLEAPGGGEALLLCEQHKATIDLLLTDVVMPRMNGRQVAERVLLLRPGIKVLYMSGYADDAIVRRDAEADAIAFVQKPITPEVLARKVREALGRAAPAAAQ